MHSWVSRLLNIVQFEVLLSALTAFPAFCLHFLFFVIDP